MVARVLAAGALFVLALWAGSVGLLWAAEPYLVFMTGTAGRTPGHFIRQSFRSAASQTATA